MLVNWSQSEVWVWARYCRSDGARQFTIDGNWPVGILPRPMKTEWNTIKPKTDGFSEVDGLPGVIIEEAPIYTDQRGSLHELWRSDEVPEGYQPLMACSSWSVPGCTRGPHEHEVQDDYFTFAGPSDFQVALWDARPGAAGAKVGWTFVLGASCPGRVFIPHGVIHAYRNVGSEYGQMVMVANVLFAGEGRKHPVDEIRHELKADSPYHFPDFTP